MEKLSRYLWSMLLFVYSPLTKNSAVDSLCQQICNSHSLEYYIIIFCLYHRFERIFLTFLWFILIIHRCQHSLKKFLQIHEVFAQDPTVSKEFPALASPRLYLVILSNHITDWSMNEKLVQPPFPGIQDSIFCIRNIFEDGVKNCRHENRHLPRQIL